MQGDHESRRPAPLPPFVARPAPPAAPSEARPLPPWTSLGRALEPESAEEERAAQLADTAPQSWSWPAPPEPASEIDAIAIEESAAGPVEEPEAALDPWSQPLQTPQPVAPDPWESAEPWTPPRQDEENVIRADAGEWTMELAAGEAIEEVWPEADVEEPWSAPAASAPGPVDELIEAAGAALELDETDLWAGTPEESDRAEEVVQAHSWTRPEAPPLATWPGEASAWDAVASTEGLSAAREGHMPGAATDYAELADRLEDFAAQLRRHGHEAIRRAFEQDRLAAALAGLVAGFQAARRDD